MHLSFAASYIPHGNVPAHVNATRMLVEHFVEFLLTRSISVLCFLGSQLPVRIPDEPVLNQRHPAIMKSPRSVVCSKNVGVTRRGGVDKQQKAKRNTRPQAHEIPSQAKAQTERDGQGDDIVSEEVHVTTDFLATDTPQQTVRDRSHAIEQLHNGTNGKRLGHQLDHLRVLGEQQCDLVSEHREERHVEETDQNTADNSLIKVLY